jgi:hypothetical protein
VTVSCWSSSDVLVRSKCIGFCPVFGTVVGGNLIRKPVSSVGTTATSSSAVAQPRTPAQKAARRRGS